jgi:hypothetical protein
MRNKDVLTINHAGRIGVERLRGSPANSAGVPFGSPSAGASDPSDRASWLGGRVLSDDEIRELSAAMVDEVRKRGPFLSLSEFVNRRLDSSNRELSLKGALQAALDSPNVSINASFRGDNRQFTQEEISRLHPEFREALEGPIAYGSSAYVNQADILRGLAEQLTPRGDTFLIRAYGDSLAADGKVVARAWCEAVVQRLPEYLNPADEAHEKQDALKSEENKTFGRRFVIQSFRYLHSAEI